MRTTLFIILLISFRLAIAQNGMSLEVFGQKAFQGQELSFFGTNVTDYNSQGFSGFVLYTYKLKKWNSILSAGFLVKKLYFTGSTDDGQDLEGNSLKAGFCLGGDYKVTDNWLAGLRIVMENNREEKEFRIATTDLFRYNLEVRTSYELIKDFSIVAFYSKGLYPLFDNYLLFNPEHQLGLGLKFDFL